MPIVAQVLPLLLVAIYFALAIFVIVLVVRFVRAQERIASALEDVARNLRRSSDQKPSL